MIRCLLLMLVLLSMTITARADLHPISSLMMAPSMMPASPPDPPAEQIIRVGILQDSSAPRNIVVGNDLYGINADYLVALHQISGLSFRITPYVSPGSLMAAMNNRQLDVAFGVAPQPLAKGYFATQPWFSSPLRIYRNRNNARQVMFNSASARIAISSESYRLLTQDFARQHRWLIRDNDLQALYMLLNQQADYVVADETSAGFLLSQLQQGQIYQLASSPDAGMLSLQAVGRDLRLIRCLDEALRALPVEVVNGIQERWSSQLPRYQDSNTASLTAMERGWIAEHPQVTYAAVSDDYPWSYRQANGDAAGYSVELLQVIGQNTGLRFKPVWVSNPHQAAALVDSGRAMIQLMRPLTGDDNMQGNTLPVWRALWGVYVNNASHGVSRWQDLNAQRIGILDGDIARHMVPAGAHLVSFSDRKALYDALANGQLNALVDNVFSARAQLESGYADSLRLAFAASDTAWPVAFGLARQQPLLRTLLNKSLQQIPASTQQRMRESWSNGSNPAQNSRTQMRPVSVFVLIAALFAIVFLLALLVRRYLEQRRERRQRRQLELEREEARRANAMKSQFLATVSHELRTPMQAILGLLEVEAARHPGANNLAVIQRSAAGLMTLLNDLQDHARVENNTFTLTPRPFDLRRWIAHLSAFYQPLLRPGGPQLIVEAITALPEWVTLDGGRLQQVANNLISNALKFTRTGEIRVTLAVLEQQQHIHLQVVDSGSGIPPEEQIRLFEPWYQPPSGRQLSVQGSGLGLSICREIVTRMGGNIQLESAVGLGTTVLVQLPLELPHPMPTPDLALAAEHQRLAPQRIAIVDDHPTNLLVMEQQLAHCGIQAEVYGEGRALLQAAQQRPFDLIFIDYSMPKPDGVTVARILRRMERNTPHHTRLIFCSADARIISQPEVQVLTDGVLVKPIALDDIQCLLQPGAADDFDDLATRLNQLAGQDSHYQQRLRATLLATLNQDRQLLSQTASLQQWPQLAASAHRLKGSWLLLGYTQGEALCQRLIQGSDQQQLDKRALNLLLSLCDKLVSRLENDGA